MFPAACLLSLLLVAVQASASQRSLGEADKVHRDAHFVRTRRSPAETAHELIFEVRRHRSVERELEHTGRRLSEGDMDSLLVRTSTDAQQTLLAFFADLNSNNNNVSVTVASREFVRASAPVSVWERVFNATFFDHRPRQRRRRALSRSLSSADSGENEGGEEDTLRRADSYSLPAVIIAHVETIFHLVDFPAPVHSDLRVDPVPSSSLSRTQQNASLSSQLRRKLQTSTPGYVTPALLKSYYGLNALPVAGNALNAQGVYAARDEALSTSDLSLFQTRNNIPPQGIANPDPLHAFPGACQVSSCIESNLDVQYLMALSSGTPTFHMHWDSADPWLEWILSLSSATVLPSVISISYSSDEAAVSSSYFHSFTWQALKLAARGTTLISSAGNTGANGDRGVCGYRTVFPATVPYVTSVGGTQGPESGNPEIVCSTSTGAAITSGGGFSTKFRTPPWQRSAVSAYFAAVAGTASAPVSGYDTDGRGFPDVSMLAKSYEIIVNGSPVYVSGTSAAAPVFAAMVSLVNAQRLRNGRKTLGWINPALYNSSLMSQVFRDITSGNNKCPSRTLCCAQGFTATTGWDPASGLGSIRSFSAFFNALVSLQVDLYVPSAAPTRSPALSVSPTRAVTRTPTRITSGWLVANTFDSSTCAASSLVAMTMYPLERCLPLYQYDPLTFTIRTRGYQKFSCGRSQASLAFYSDSTCRSLQPTKLVQSFPLATCNPEGIEDTYYYNNDGYFSTSFVCSRVTDYTSLLPANTGSYAVRSTFRDTACSTGQLSSYEVYRNGFCFNKQFGDLPLSSTRSFKYQLPQLLKYSDTKCDQQDGAFTTTSEQVSNIDRCGYSTSLIEETESIALGERWTLRSS